MTKYLLWPQHLSKQNIILKWVHHDNSCIDAYWRVGGEWYLYAQGTYMPRHAGLRVITEEEAFMFILENE